MTQGLKALFGSRVYRRAGEFGPLTPAMLTGQDYVRYRAELQRALRLPKVRNIAVTGGYGAGKSSFIQSFAADHDEYNFCFISLATFNSGVESRELLDAEGSPVQSEKLSKFPERDPIERIEATIVQQLLYSVKDSSIPQTRLKRINHISTARASLYSAFTIAVGVAVLRICGLPKELNALAVDSPVRDILQSPLVASVFVAATAIFLLAYKLISAVLNLKLQGVTVKGLAWAQPAIASVLHKQLDEIVYLFERNKIDIVLIEDLDRFTDASPFTRLREINFIVNSSPSITRPVHFVYMIRDDLFSAEDRVKFFDYVLPVVSVINTDNSKQKMLDIIRDRRWKPIEIPSEDLIEAVCYYVDDMRQLVNILNEFDLYRKVVNRGRFLSPNKLFAAVVAKCLFPKQYSKLLKGEGLIYEAIKSYVPWAAERDAHYLAQVAELEVKIEAHTIGLARSERELCALVWMEAAGYEKSYQLESITIPSGERLTFNEFVGQESIHNLIDQPALLSLQFQHRGIRTVDTRDLLGYGAGSLGSRIAAIQEVGRGALRRLVEMKAKQASEQIVALSQAILHSDFASHVASLSNEWNLGPIGHLIAKGHLGEDYFDYSGFFYEGSISRWDKEVMLRIKAGELLHVNTRIDNADAVVKRLSEADLRDGRGLVLALIASLFSGEESSRPDTRKRYASLVDAASHEQRLDALLFGINGHASLIPVVQVLLKGSAESLVTILGEGFACSASPCLERICGAIISSAEGTADKIGDELASDLDASITGLTDGAAFASAISDRGCALRWLDAQGTWIERLGREVSREDLGTLLRLDAVAVNLHNIRVIAAAYELEWSDRTVALRDIRSLPRGRLRKTLLASPAKLVTAILEQRGDIEDDGEHVLWALRHVQEDTELRVALIERVDFNVESLQDIAPSHWLQLVINARIKPTWQNLILLSDGLSVDDFGACMQVLTSSASYAQALSRDISALSQVSDEVVVSLASKLLTASGALPDQIGGFAGRSGIITFVSGDEIPDLTAGVVAGIAGELNGRWVDWVFERLQSSDVDAAARYLRACGGDPALTASGTRIRSKVLLATVISTGDANLKAEVLSACLKRIDDWTNEAADQVIEIVLALESRHLGASASLLGGAGELLVAASEDVAIRVLTLLVNQLAWVEVRSILLIAGGGFLSKLQSVNETVSLPMSDKARELVDAMYRISVLRKPAYSRKRVAVQASAKF